ncbi:hypothetical protein [Helicobacter cinaedi]|uniref:hypothetical protein n=1 Tax=Helicobacter cinaedi TaxID=213 RepID=UPI001E292C91|nr:hypothetical protein [Helicobacter cinaedi]
MRPTSVSVLSHTIFHTNVTSAKTYNPKPQAKQCPKRAIHPQRKPKRTDINAKQSQCKNEKRHRFYFFAWDSFRNANPS